MRQVVAAADGDAAVPRSPSAASGAVVDDERLRPGGLDAHPEAAQPVVPGDPGLVGGLEVSTVRLVRVSLTLAVRFPVVVFMIRRGLAGGRRSDQPSVNTSRPIPGRSGTRGNRCPKDPPQLIDNSLIHRPITHVVKVAVSRYVPLVRSPAVSQSQECDSSGGRASTARATGLTTGRPRRASSSCRGVSRPTSASFPPMRAGIARRRGENTLPPFPGGALTGCALASSTSVESLETKVLLLRC